MFSVYFLREIMFIFLLFYTRDMESKAHHT